jgi:hypothetical protein
MDSYELNRFKDNGFELDVNVSPQEETVWLTKDEMALLFERDRTAISRHIHNIYREGELDPKSTCAKNARVLQRRARVYEMEIYNLDVIISVGYRVKSKRGVLFRKWANSVLKQYLLKGYVLDNNRIIVSKDNYLNLENDIKELKSEVGEIKEKMFLEPVKERVFFEGQFYDAYEFISSLIDGAKKNIVIIDPYFDREAFKFLKGASACTRIDIFCSNKTKLSRDDIAEFEKQYHKLNVIKNDSVHDRFIFIDGQKAYSVGSSLNHLGRKTFLVHRFDDPYIVESVINRIKR